MLLPPLCLQPLRSGVRDPGYYGALRAAGFPTLYATRSSDLTTLLGLCRGYLHAGLLKLGTPRPTLFPLTDGLHLAPSATSWSALKIDLDSSVPSGMASCQQRVPGGKTSCCQPAEPVLALGHRDAVAHNCPWNPNEAPYHWILVSSICW